MSIRKLRLPGMPIWLLIIIGLCLAVGFWGFIGWAIIELLDILREATQ